MTIAEEREKLNSKLDELSKQQKTIQNKKHAIRLQLQALDDRERREQLDALQQALDERGLTVDDVLRETRRGVEEPAPGLAPDYCDNGGF